MTDKFKEKCKESANCDRLGKIIYEENEIRYDGNLASLELVEDCYVNGTIIGTTNTKGITINTIGSETLYEKEIQAQIGIKYDDTDEEYINLGKYTIDKPSATETSNLGQYKGYDYLDKLNADYKCSYTDFTNITVADILQDLCNQCGLEIASLEFENSDFPVSGNIFENYKCKDVLSDILELASSFGTIDKETNKLTFKKLGKESVVTLTKDNYSVLTKNQIYGPINSFTVKESQIEGENVSIQDDESIEANGENMFAIVDNMFCYTPELRKRALDSIWKNIKGLTYVDCKIESYTGLPYLNSGDKITVEDDEGNFFDTYVLKHTFTYDGTFKSVIESPALTKQQNAIKSDVSLREKLNQTVINVYKDKKQIEALVTETSEATEKLTKFEMDLDSIKQQVSEIDDFTTDGETTNGNLNLNDIGNGYLLNLKIRPKDEHVAPTFPNFTIYPSDSTFTRDGLSIVRIKNLTTGSFTDYEIPVDLYYKDENTYDALEYKYGNNKCTITKKLKMVDGVLTEMESPVSTEYDFPVIDTTDGTYSIALLNYDQAYIYAKMIGKNDFSDTFALKRELSSAITQTKEYIQSEVKNLSTQVNGDIENLSSSITQTAEEIESDVSSYKKTIDGEITELNSKITQTASSFTTEINNHKKAVDGEISDLDSKITQTASSITSDVNSKIQGVNGDIEELSSKIEQTATSITNSVNGQIKDINGNITTLSASLSLKLNTEDLCSELNASADKISFTADRFSWSSTYSSMTEDGKFTSNSGTFKNVKIEDGTILLNAESGATSIELRAKNTSRKVIMSPSGMSLLVNNNLVPAHVIINASSYDNEPYVEVLGSNTSNQTYITGAEIKTPKLTQTSLKTNKKNFEKFEGALPIIQEIDLYKYNLKSEKDSDKKHIGFVIDKDYKYSSEITSTDKDGNEIGVDIYSMVSLCMQAIKEQQSMLEEIREKEIEKNG